MTGYSDRINHALAFAAKHHDQQVRRGVRLPYLTQPANVAVILTRYGQSERVVVAGILLNIVRDAVSDWQSAETMGPRLAEKFGKDALATVLEAAPRRYSEAGVELSSEERRNDYLNRLAGMSDAARWVIAADALHETATALADVRRTIESRVVWSQRGDDLRYHREIVEGLHKSGFRAPIMDELDEVLRSLDAVR